MPELPEVETTVRALQRPLIGQVITAVRNSWPRHIATPTLPELQQRIANQRIEAISRRAKYLVFHLSAGDSLIIHLKMTGHLFVAPAASPTNKHTHTIFELASGQELRFQDARKFGRVYLVENPQQLFANIGPEPLADTFTVAQLEAQLNGRSRALKPLLLDQNFIAGVGNIYADEALFYAHLHPERKANSLTAENKKELHTAIQKVLQLGLEREGATIRSYMKPDGSKGDMQNAVAVYGRTNKPCYECGHPIRRVVLGGRSTHFCPNCQR